jgi:hypothetical protein
MKNEEWKPAVGFEHRYQVSSLGRVRSLFGRKFAMVPFSGSPDHRGYMFTTLIQQDGSTKHMSIHRLVASAWVPNPKQHPQVNHKNGIKNDNRPRNLEWCTGSENVQHAYDVLLRSQHGPRGATHPLAKLTTSDVLAIRALEGISAPQAVADQFGVSRRYVYQLWKRQCRKAS